MTNFPSPNARPAGDFNYAFCLVLALWVLLPSESFAQVQSVTVKKGFNYIQSSATTVTLDPAPNNYSFGADVDGQNIGGITAPTVTGPFNTASLGTRYNNGTLLYSTGDKGWRFGFPNANDAGRPTLASLNSDFGSGTYTFTVNGASIPLQLTGDAYPNVPTITLTGGTWSNGQYEIDPSQALTITTNAFTAYGSHADDLICIIFGGGNNFVKPFDSVAPFGCNWTPLSKRQFHSNVPGANFLSYTIPPNTLVAGQIYGAVVGFAAMVDVKPNAALPGSVNTAYYDIHTIVTIKAIIPVFPMVVTSNITPTIATAAAAIQYRPQDVGTTGSVYVFALAPANKVTNVSAAALSNHKGPVARSIGATTAVTPLPCVLGQLTASGQLTAVTAATMQAYLTGVLSSQGASVSVLNNVSTALVQGAVFYVGYGANSTAMINNGIHRNVVTVPGTQVCAPQAPQTGWWWNAAEGGRGFGIEVSGNNLFMSGYLYDDTGHATWIVSPGPHALDGSLFNGTMYQVANGQTLTGAYKAPAPPTTAGPITLSFTDARNGTLIWAGGSIPLVRFDDIIGSQNGITPAFVPENGWWWNAGESGRGFFLEFKNNFAFIAGYMYEADGRPVWYVTQNPMTTPQSFSSTWLQVANGQTMTGSYKPATVINNNVGPVSILFQDAANATLTLPGGRQVAITRQRF